MATAGKQAAPHVDYDNQSRNLAIGGILVGGLALLSQYYKSADVASPAAAAAAAEDSSFWFLWMVLWGVYRLLQLAFGVALLLLVVLVVRQRSILYVPVPPGTERSTSRQQPIRYQSPKQWGLLHENLTITTSDGVKLNAWLVYHPRERCREKIPYTLVYFHGNAGNIGHRLENIKQMHEELFLNILIVDYRGYGDSEDGSGPSEKGFMLDADATYRWLANRIRNPKENDPARMSADRILLFGRSIGGAVAIILNAQLLRGRIAGASDKDSQEPPLPLPAGLVLENTFTGLRDMAVTIFPFLRFLSPLLRKPLLFDEWRSAESLGYLAKQHHHWCCCLLSGKQDKIVPPIQMMQLRDLLKINEPKVLKMFVFEHGGHNDTPHIGGAEYWEKMRKYMKLLEESEAERLEALEKAGWASA